MKRDLIHDIFRKGPGRIPLSSRARCNTVRRSLYTERARILRDEPLSDLASVCSDLTFRIEHATDSLYHYLVVERGTENAVDAEVREALGERSA